MKLELKRLEYDSKLFGFDVFELTSKNALISKNIETILKEVGISPKLLYFKTKTKDNKSWLSKRLNTYWSEKLTFELTINEVIEFDTDKHLQPLNVFNSQIEDLSINSGKFSRFKLDSKIPEKVFRELYIDWIKKSIIGEIADVCLVYILENNFVGLVTLAFKNGYSQIGLLSVNDAYQGKGIGRKLIEECISQTMKKGIKKIRVQTQKKNIIAQEFYRRNNFTLIDTEQIVHLWLH